LQSSTRLQRSSRKRRTRSSQTSTSQSSAHRTRERDSAHRWTETYHFARLISMLAPSSSLYSSHHLTSLLWPCARPSSQDSRKYKRWGQPRGADRAGDCAMPRITGGAGATQNRAAVCRAVDVRTDDGRAECRGSVHHHVVPHMLLHHQWCVTPYSILHFSTIL